MPFLFLVGAAPNAIAYGSKQFTSVIFPAPGIIGEAFIKRIIRCLRKVEEKLMCKVAPAELLHEDVLPGRRHAFFKFGHVTHTLQDLARADFAKMQMR